MGFSSTFTVQSAINSGDIVSPIINVSLIFATIILSILVYSYFEAGLYGIVFLKINSKKVLFLLFITVCFLSFLPPFFSMKRSYFIIPTNAIAANTGNLDQQIKNSFINGDYLLTAKLLEQQITALKEKASKDKRDTSSLYEKHRLLASVYAWKLNKLDQALNEYQKAIKFKKSSPGIAKTFTIELLLLGEIYEIKKEFSIALDNYKNLLYELVAVHEGAEDDVSMMISEELIEFVKYRIDSINLKNRTSKGFKPLLKKLKLSSVSFKSFQLFVFLLNPTAAYDFDIAVKTDLVDYIKQSQTNFGSMISNYILILNASASYVDESSEKAMQAYMLKYPESYLSLSLRYLFYKFYKENGQVEKEKRLLHELKKIAKKRGIKLIIGPDKRFSSPEKTWKTYKRALLQGDFEAVMECYIPGRWKVKKVYNLLGKEHMKEVGGKMGSIGRITGSEERAKYRVKRMIEGTEITFYIYFYNIGGEWKMDEF